MDEEAAGECGDGECRVGGAVLRGKDAAADLVRCASLNKGDCGDITESSARAGERHAGQADREDGGGAG